MELGERAPGIGGYEPLDGVEAVVGPARKGEPDLRRQRVVAREDRGRLRPTALPIEGHRGCDRVVACDEQHQRRRALAGGRPARLAAALQQGDPDRGRDHHRGRERDDRVDARPR